MPPKMVDRMEALETQMGTVTDTLQELALQLQQQSMVLKELSNQMGKKVVHEGETSTGDSNSGESRLAGKKVKLPVFEGDDPVAWITRAEIYFDVQGTPDELRVKLARLSMEGSTIHWFNMLRETEDELSWEKLKRALIARYGGRRLENPFEELLTLRQRGSVEEFVEAFELLSSQVGRLPEDQYLGYFMSGLKPPIRWRVRTLNPSTRMEMMRIAKDVEDELKEEEEEEGKRVTRKGGYERSGQGDWAGSASNRSGLFNRDVTRFTKASGSNQTRSRSSVGSHAHSSSSLGSTARKGDNDHRAGSTERWKGVRSFQVDEIAERRAKGLCFKCGGKYHPTLHKCPERAMRVLILGEGETMNEEGEIVMLEQEVEEEEEEEAVECKAMGVLGCLGDHQTMKLAGQVGNVELLILVDSGASHNFIDPKITSALGLTITPITTRSIKLGDGHKVITRGVCKGIKAKVGNIEITIDALVLDLGGLDLVLGVSWLSTLGKVIMDWKHLTMQFVQGEHVVKLQGMKGRSSYQSNLHSFLSDTQGRNLGEGWWLQFQATEATKEHHDIPQELGVVLTEFPAVFTKKMQLPPVRSKVHQIVLNPEHGPINVRPYRYPHHQKEEIERQVAELLEAGIIRPSMSAFSSPVILVKKKDKSWRMCVDYRALNKATIPDKYPIPIVDELLDELNGAVMFSKIDLKSGYHQIRVLEADIPKTAFRTHNGHYEYLVMPFGLMNAPATFQAIMNDIFRPYLRKFVLVFFDDILIYSRSLLEHQNHLKLVLTVLSSNCFVANQAKCKFGCAQIDYLGHIISGKGVAVDPEKIKCIVEWPEPKNVKGVRGFLGLTGYYRKFVKNYGKMAKPLTELTKKRQFHMG
ncbi:uncharacterized protein LOC130722049 isoform X1 [Lotus japonicus]|uniref:uncharacterized protein LOC130722049 isoform X1 n=1 Tax=Lotus japonicus TaxID=34305 RepID=UPI00258B73DC|nr:uncharacterized protein LOC130722049 isoform X1 [Lotus japonicus]